jgi:hypothetical protein
VNEAETRFWGGPPNSPVPWAWGTRGVGLVLLILTLTPVYRLLRSSDAVGFGGSSLLRGAADLASSWWGLLTALVLGGGLALLMPTDRARGTFVRFGETLSEIPRSSPSPRFLWTLSAGLALAASLALFAGYPTVLDGMVNLLQSRLLATGHASVALPDPAAAWLIPSWWGLGLGPFWGRLQSSGNTKRGWRGFGGPNPGASDPSEPSTFGQRRSGFPGDCSPPSDDPRWCHEPGRYPRGSLRSEPGNPGRRLTQRGRRLGGRSGSPRTWRRGQGKRLCGSGADSSPGWLLSLLRPPRKEGGFPARIGKRGYCFA